MKLLDPKKVICTELETIDNTLDTYGVVAYKLNIENEDKIKALEKTKFYNTVNCVLKEPVLEPSIDEKLNPSTFKLRKVPDSHSGFIGQYFTPIHHLVHENNNFQNCMNYLYNNEVKYLPNRLRISNKYKYDKDSLHIEGEDIFNNNNGIISFKRGELSIIVGISGIREFIFWDLSNKDLNPLHDYWKKKGSKNFTKIDPGWMNTNYLGCRVKLTIDCTNDCYLIIWRENIPHEIACSPALSIFISPTKCFDNKKTKSNTLQPNELNNLTSHESNLIGMCYQQSGLFWPSGKKTYMFCHQRSITHWLPKIKDYYKQNEKMRMRIITNGTVNHNNQSYKNKLAERNIVLPELIFSMPKLLIDISILSDRILSDYGFI